ncbi:MAG: tRNA lysidine(34) synthetase TilS [Desulfotalea sp.]
MTNKLSIVLAKKINELIENGDVIVVGVSGGSDSTALLHLLIELNMDLVVKVIYIDHDLRPTETGEEVSFVKSQTQKLGADFFYAKVDVKTFSKEQGISTEEAARILRYQEFRKLRDKTGAKFIAVGHNSDDQVEEFLIRLLRGSGRKGLAGMSVVNNDIIRPVLSFSKKELQKYLIDKGIHHCEDSSNSEPIYLRNKVRLNLLPKLKEYNPSIKENLLNLGKILTEEEKLLNELTQQSLKKCTVSSPDKHKTTVILDIFNNEATAIKRRIVENICWQIGNKPSFKNIEKIRLLAGNGENGKTLHLSQGLRVVKQQGELLFSYPLGKTSTRENSSTEELNLTIPGLGEYLIGETGNKIKLTMAHSKPNEKPGQLVLSSKNISFPLYLRYHKNGEKFKPLGSDGSKKISRYLTDKKIHGENKRNYPTIIQKKDGSDEVIAILGLTCDNKFKYDSTDKEFLIINSTE